MEDARREQLKDFIDHGLDEFIDRLIGRVQAIIGKTLHRLILTLLGRIAQLRQRLQRGIGVAGNVDFRDDGDGQAIGQRNDLTGDVLGIVATGGLWTRAQQRRQGLAVTAPGADLGQLGECLDLDAPGFVFGQVPVELVELVPGHQLDELADFSGRIELARHIEMAAAIGKAGFVGDGATGGKDEGLWVLSGAAQDLPQRDQTIEHALTRGCRYSGGSFIKGDLIGFGAQARFMRDGYGHACFCRWPHQTFNGKEIVDQPSEGRCGLARIIALRL